MANQIVTVPLLPGPKPPRGQPAECRPSCLSLVRRGPGYAQSSPRVHGLAPGHMLLHAHRQNMVQQLAMDALASACRHSCNKNCSPRTQPTAPSTNTYMPGTTSRAAISAACTQCGPLLEANSRWLGVMRNACPPSVWSTCSHAPISKGCQQKASVCIALLQFS
jgi:hypothetical protein